MATEHLKGNLTKAQKQGRKFAAGGWKVAGIVVERNSVVLGEFVFGINPWDYEWESLDVNVRLPHPQYPNQIEPIRN